MLLALCAGAGAGFKNVLSNPYVGMAWFAEATATKVPDKSRRAALAVQATTAQAAAAAGDIAAQSLLRYAVGADSKDVMDAMAETLHYDTPLMIWDTEHDASAQQLTIALQLVEDGADVDAETSALDTPLTLAASVGNAAVVDLLCRLGANTELRRCVSRSQPYTVQAFVFLQVLVWPGLQQFRDKLAARVVPLSLLDSEIMHVSLVRIMTGDI